jgi:hypothetical protein
VSEVLEADGEIEAKLLREFGDFLELIEFEDAVALNAVEFSVYMMQALEIAKREYGAEYGAELWLDLKRRVADFRTGRSPAETRIEGHKIDFFKRKLSATEIKGYQEKLKAMQI